MYAIIKTGGKQYRAAKDEVIVVEKIEGEPGSEVTLDEVLSLVKEGDITLGSPFIKGAKVMGTIVRQGKGPKIDAFNYKAKKNIRKRWGHRQPLTFVKITEVIGG
jgi:large subunit ribosomal protein L21